MCIFHWTRSGEPQGRSMFSITHTHIHSFLNMGELSLGNCWEPLCGDPRIPYTQRPSIGGLLNTFLLMSSSFHDAFFGGLLFPLMIQTLYFGSSSEGPRGRSLDAPLTDRPVLDGGDDGRAEGR